MRIVQVNIPRKYTQASGLHQIEMDRLGQLVILAGKNGAGKTRLLETISGVLSNHPSLNSLDEYANKVDNLRNQIFLVKQNIKILGDDSYETVKNKDQRNREILKGLKTISELNNEIDILIDKINSNKMLVISDDNGQRNVLNYLPTELIFRDPQTLSPRDTASLAELSDCIGMNRLAETSLPKIQVISSQYWNSTHPQSQFSEGEKKRIKEDYENLNNIIHSLLGIGLGNDDLGQPTIFGFPIGNSKLSAGQKILLQLAVAIHCQGAQLSDIILVLDEPENHLHPGATIEIIEKLLEKISDGQIWMSTHSVSILSHFAEKASLWYMDEGKISNAGKIQAKVLESLLGGSDRVASQVDFLEHPERVALIRYASECLVPPKSIMTNSGDAQVEQISKAIQKLRTQGRPLKTLDYGAGKGRLLSNLTDSELIAIDYFAYDVDAIDKEECESHINKVYGTQTKRWFNNITSLLTEHNKKSFDIVVMCNVLHEIEPNAWGRIFGKDGDISGLLKDDGHLLIVENQRVSVGEKAHRYGFIVLDTPSIKDLFGIEGTDSIIVDEQRDGRLKAHLIHRRFLERYTPETREKALNTHLKNAEDAINRIRNKSTSGDGTLFAFWVHQYANTHIALQDGKS